MSRSRSQVVHLALAGIAFGVIEGAVVVYLRSLVDPQGFKFPLVTVPALILKTELVRELATLALLAGIAGAVARDFLRRFAVFLFLFGLWDLAYYAMLRIALGWPESLLTWDILFLIPVPWAAPILAPVLVSLAFIAGSLVILLANERRAWRLGAADWALEIVAAALVLASFLWNAGSVMRGVMAPVRLLDPTPRGWLTGSAIQAGELPEHYPWWLFALGLILGICVFMRVALRGSVASQRAERHT